MAPIPIPIILSPVARFSQVNGEDVRVIGAHVEAWSLIPPGLLPVGVLSGVYLDLRSGQRLAVVGDLDTAENLLLAAIQPLCSCGQQPQPFPP